MAVGLPYKLWPARLTDEINSIPPISPHPPFHNQRPPTPSCSDVWLLYSVLQCFTVFYSVVLQVLSAEGLILSYFGLLKHLLYFVLLEHFCTRQGFIYLPEYYYVNPRVLCITSGLKGKTVQSTLVLEASSDF